MRVLLTNCVVKAAAIEEITGIRLGSISTLAHCGLFPVQLSEAASSRSGSQEIMGYIVDPAGVSRSLPNKSGQLRLK